jgi:hypothetical protein
MELHMKQHRNVLPTLILAGILGTLSATASANGREASGDTQAQPQAVNAERLPDDARDRSKQRRAERADSLKLSLEQMDQVHAGAIPNESPSPVPQYGSEGTGVTCRHLSCYGL